MLRWLTDSKELSVCLHEHEFIFKIAFPFRCSHAWLDRGRAAQAAADMTKGFDLFVSRYARIVLVEEGYRSHLSEMSTIIATSLRNENSS